MSQFEEASHSANNQNDEILRTKLGYDNLRTLARMGRGILKQLVRSEIHKLTESLPDQDVLLFKAYNDGLNVNVLLLQNHDVAGESNTLVLSNTFAPSDPNDLNYPDGQKIFLNDLILPNNTGRSKWLNCSSETVLYDPGSNILDSMNNKATFLRTSYDSVTLYGNASDNYGNFQPWQASGLEDIELHADQLWTTFSALRLCSQSTFEPDVKEIILG